MNRETKIGQWSCRGDDGSSRVVIAYQQWVDAGGLDDGGDSIPGLKRLATADGSAVNRLEKGRYQIVSTGVVLTTDAEDAV